MIGELSTSRHDVLQIRSFFSHYNFENYTNQSWLCSCAAHTMKRFSNSLTRFKITKNQHIFMCYAFSLLLNSTSLSMIKEYFRFICIVLLSKSNSQIVVESKNKLKEALLIRPNNQDQLDVLVKQVNKQFSHSTDYNVEDDQNDKPILDLKDDQKEEEDFIKKSIKEASPFTQIFENIKQNIISELMTNEFSILEENEQFMPFLVKHLLDNFMPYSFIWASFTLVNMEQTRMTNGIIEGYNSFRKNKGDLIILPHRYLTTNINTVIGS